MSAPLLSLPDRSLPDRSLPDLKTLFARALELPTLDDRVRFLDSACEDAPELRAELEQLLAAHDRAGNFLVAVGSVPRGSSAALPVGSFVDKYQLVDVLGEGGMGVVYRAQQEHPIKRQVALKIIKPGMDSRQIIARFESERQVLALLDHPHIAKVLDAGSTESGLPYFVLELVQGEPVTSYCDARQMPLRERLALFIRICRAIQHAHHKGIIHRDIKPSNILVATHDNEPVPKVIDFGVAKALGQSPLAASTTHQHSLTGFAQMIGTPLYMSPEQADLASADIDTRTDVYSLGVLLYELLTGTTPFDKDRLHSATFDEMRRILREEEPETISQRLAKTRRVGSAHQDNSGVSPVLHPSFLRLHPSQDLDWIAAKCLEKEPCRRYDTADNLAADLTRFLADEPVLACPPSPAYRFRKFAKKYRAALTTLSLVAGALVVGTVVSAWQAIRATQAETLAKNNESRALAEGQKVAAALASEAQQRQRAEDHARVVESQRQLLADNQRVSGLVIDEILNVVRNPSPNVASRHQNVLAILGKLESVGPDERATAYRRVGELLVGMQQHESAFAAFHAGLALNPQDRPLLLARADAHFREKSFAKAVDDYTSAIGSEGEVVAVQVQVPFVRRGLSYYQLGEIDLALADFEQAHRLAPLPTIKALGLAFEGQYVVSVVPDQRIIPAILELAKATASESCQDPTRHAELAGLLVHCGQFAAARVEYESLRAAHESRKNAPFANWSYFSAVLAARAGDEEAYRQGCQSMLARYAQSTDLGEAVYTAWSCALAPGATDDYTPLIDLARRAHRADSKEGAATMALGAILLRAGLFTEAHALLQQVPNQKTALGLATAYYPYLLAIVHHHLGNQEPARRWLTEADRRFVDAKARPINWRQRLTLEILQSEATTLIAKPATF